MSTHFFLDRVGEVVLGLCPRALSWELVRNAHNESTFSPCLRFCSRIGSQIETKIDLCNVYAVEEMPHGVIHEPLLPNAGRLPPFRESEMHRFVVHGCLVRKNRNSPWRLVSYLFGHRELTACQEWSTRIMDSLGKQVGRPRNLLVFVSSFSGKGRGLKTWEKVRPIFDRAKVTTEVKRTEGAGHAFDMMQTLTNQQLNHYDGVVVVGGDGLFNEALNGLLISRHAAPNPPAPPDFYNFEAAASTTGDEEHHPLLQQSGPRDIRMTVFSENVEIVEADTSGFPIPNERFTFGLIPAGSTDANVICTTGVRDPVTSALQIVIGKRVSLDIARVKWRRDLTSATYTRYAASFVGYGFYGDVIAESEKYRWMGPKRYDFSGAMMFMKHRSYNAEVAYIEVPSGVTNMVCINNFSKFWRRRHPDRMICRVNCLTCSNNSEPFNFADAQWQRSRGRYISVGAPINSCRNEMAPDGLVADAHLSDGFLHLVLIKNCSRPKYLCHLLHLARKGCDPLMFDFVELRKTPAFIFVSENADSAWNVDGELLQASILSAQVFRGLIRVFGNGPEV